MKKLPIYIIFTMFSFLYPSFGQDGAAEQAKPQVQQSQAEASQNAENTLSETGGRSAYQTMVISSSRWPAPANLSMMKST